MKDLLFQKDKDWIQKHLEGRYSGRFVRIEVGEEPELTGEGQRVLFSDGQEVMGESVIKEVSQKEVRFDPLTPVRKPNPKPPQHRGFVYVDADQASRYSIEFMGVEHSFKTLHDLMRGVLEKREEARNSDDVLYHTIWRDVQGLNLNSRDEFCDRIPRGKIDSVREEVQVEMVVFPPTTAEVVKKRFRESSKATRIHGSLEEYVEAVKKFYLEKGRKRIVEDIDDVLNSGRSAATDDVRELVKQKVASSGGVM